MEIILLGKETIEKKYFMLYFAKIISQVGRTILFSNTIKNQENIDAFELAENLFVTNRNKFSKQEDYKYFIYNSIYENYNNKKENNIYLITSSEKETLEYNLNLLKKICCNNEFSIPIELVYLDLHQDSKIDKEYMTNKINTVMDENSIIKTYEIFYDEYDYINMLENQYDETLRIKDLSKNYKSTLYKIAFEFLEISKKEFKQIIKKAERSKS